MNSLPFGTYVRLYTLHQIEQPPDVLLWMRIAVLRYSLAPLDRPTVDAAYASDPAKGPWWCAWRPPPWRAGPTPPCRRSLLRPWASGAVR